MDGADVSDGSAMNRPKPRPVLGRERRTRLALVRTVRDLRQSVDRRRPIALPNLLRLLRRRLSDVDPAPLADAAVQRLANFYKRHQPFSAHGRGHRPPLRLR